MNRKILTFVGCLSLAATAASPVQASYLSGYGYANAANKKVVVTKSMRVYRVKTGSCEAKNHFYAAGKVKKGTVLYRSQWFMATGGGWVIKNSQYKPGKRRFYFVQAPEKTKWFKAYKAVKKTAKKKVAKKTSKKKATKKMAKKKVAKNTSKKKATKKTTKKKVDKKTTKKTIKKKAVKKPAKKAAQKSSKKTVKKTANKPAPKKNVSKPLTMAQKYTPKVKEWTTKLKWGDDLGSAEDYVTNDWELPSDTTFSFEKPVNVRKGGFYQTKITVAYPDGSKESVGPVSFEVAPAQADAYQVAVKNTTVPYGHDIDIRKDIVTNPTGYFPNDPAQVENDTTLFYFCRADGNPLANDPDTSIPGSNDYYIRVDYPDGSYQVSQKFTLTVSQPDNQVYHPQLKTARITMPVGDDIEGSSFELLHPQDFIANTGDLPKGTKYEIKDDYDCYDESSSYVTVEATFPDGTVWHSPMFLLCFN
ncbi:MAG: Rib/alpha-like domain-containing protein [Lactobacillus porci]|nr:Rib/alpha-like domain-containing protein [Lactobacillus porci]